MSLCYGYTRASTKDQQNTHHVQAEAVEKYYREKLLPKLPDLGWANVFRDRAISGKKPFTEREIGKEVNLRLQRGDHVVCFKMDRAFRNTLDFLAVEQMWDNRGIALHLLDIPWFEHDMSKPLRDMVRTIMVSQCEFGRR